MIPRFFSEKKLILALEYGLILSETANELGITLTQDHILRLEEIIKKEFSKKNPTQLSVDMTVNILAALEPKEKMKCPKCGNEFSAGDAWKSDLCMGCQMREEEKK